jgi:hypothetical protein
MLAPTWPADSAGSRQIFRGGLMISVQLLALKISLLSLHLRARLQSSEGFRGLAEWTLGS